MNHRPRKRFGQNFLRDDVVIQTIINAIDAEPNNHVVEIGPGQGALTEFLIASGCKLDAIEIDLDLRNCLLASFSVHKKFKLYNADALKFDFSGLVTNNQKLRVVGNLPYNISTPLLFKLLDNTDIIEDMHFMLQLEVVERLAAKPGNKDWGRLSVMTQRQCEVTHLFNIPPEAFFPSPKVQSSIVRLVPRITTPLPHHAQAKFAKVVQLAFAQRRKTLRNNFKHILNDASFNSVEIDPNARAETLDLEAFIRLSSLI